MKISMLAIAMSFAVVAFSQPYCWKVSDGDTIWIDENGESKKIRMVDIDAPEMNQPYGPESADKLAGLVLGKHVTIKSFGTDKYGRSLDCVYVKDANGKETDVNLRMVETGMAWVYYSCKREAYRKAQESAKSRKLGLWAGASPVNPYQWRKEQYPAANDSEYNKRTVPLPQTVQKRPSKNPPTAASEKPSVSGGIREEYRPGGAMPVGSRKAAPVCDKWPDTGFWLSTGSNKRHNGRCENYRKTRGYPCRKEEGVPCKKCGG